MYGSQIFWSQDCIYINGLTRNGTTLGTVFNGACYLCVPFIELYLSTLHFCSLMYAAIDISRISFSDSLYFLVTPNLRNFTFIQESCGSCVERTIVGEILVI